MSFLAGPSRRQHDANVVTYRHLLSAAAMTPFNPLRTIGHCDIDGAFAQFEQVRLGLSDDVPLICIQWNSIIAVNYPARAYGIKRDMTSMANAGRAGVVNHIEEAKKRCPHLVVQHVATYREGEDESGYWDDVDRRTHKVSLDPYRRESLKILAVFREMAPKAELEKASIDEAFMDLTPMVVDRLLAVHPHLATVPNDAPDGLDSPLPEAPAIDWSKTGNVIPIVKDSDRLEGEDDTDEADTWQDWALCIGAEIMAEVRAEVWKRLHYTCSAGIAHNKAMAKICSAWKKPNAQTVLRAAATPGFLHNMDFTEIRFLGGKLGHAIAEEFGAKTVGDMMSVSLEDMQAKFGEESIWVYNILRGIDHTEVKEKLATKSMLASKNTIPTVKTSREGHHWLSVLAGELNVRLREAREVTPGIWPKTVVLTTRNMGDVSRTRQGPFPFTRNLTAEYIARHARKLWEEAVAPMKEMKLNNIGIALTGLERLEEGQQGIEGFFSAGQPQKRPREDRTPVANDTVPGPKRTKLPTLHTKPKPTVLETFLAKNKVSPPSTPPPADRPIVIDEDEEDDHNGNPNTEADGTTWQCSKCDTTLSAPTANYLAAARQEHEDYHFALSLHESESGSGSENRASAAVPSRTDKGSTKQSKKKAKPVGIKAFFAPK